jgi:hypothetical protein
MRNWLGLHIRERVCSIDRKGIGMMVFQARERIKQSFVEKAIKIKFCLILGSSL